MTNEELTKWLKKQGLSHIDARIKDGRTRLGKVLLAAAIVLLAAGANIDAKGKNSSSTLHDVARDGNSERNQELLEEGFHIDAVDDSHIDATDENGDTTALHLAAWAGQVQEVKELLVAGANTDAKDKYGRTALHNAAQRGRTKVAKVLLKAGAAIYAKDEDGRTALHLAALDGQTEVAEYLRTQGAKE